MQSCRDPKYKSLLGGSKGERGFCGQINRKLYIKIGKVFVVVVDVVAEILRIFKR